MVEKEEVEFAREEGSVFGEERGALGRYEKRKKEERGKYLLSCYLKQHVSCSLYAEKLASDP